MLLAAFALACGGSDSKDPQAPRPEQPGDSPTESDVGDEDPPENSSKPMERLLALFASLDKTIDQQGESCPDFTKSLSAWLLSHGDEIRDLLIMDLSDEAHEAIEKGINDVATTVVFAASECGSSDAAVAAYDEFDALVL